MTGFARILALIASVGCAVAAVASPTVGLTIDAEALFSRAAMERPPRDVSFLVRADFDDETLRGGTLVVSLLPNATHTAAPAPRVLTFRSPSRETSATFAGPVPWGGYLARAALRDARGAELARALGCSRAWVTKVLGLPDLRETP
jgi:hypothetical protein